MERYEVEDLLKLTPEEELKISETKKISKKRWTSIIDWGGIWYIFRYYQ